MKKIFLSAFAFYFYSTCLHAQTASSLSGVYQNLTLGLDPSRGSVTGSYLEIDTPLNQTRNTCSFYLSGKIQGDRYAIEAWQPSKPKSEVTKGELKIFPGDRPSVLLKLEELSRDCMALKPKMGKPEGILLEKGKDGGWTEVRVVRNSKALYYQAPDTTSPLRENAKRGTVLTVMARQAGWAQVQADQKPKGWIKESDLFPSSPGETMAAPNQAEFTPPPKPEPSAAPPPEAKTNSRADLLQRLKALHAESFGLALRVLANPAERSALASRQQALEKELNTLVVELNKADPSAYRSESARIYDVYLDLQYVRQEQPVVSLRLRQEILKKSL